MVSGKTFRFKSRFKSEDDSIRSGTLVAVEMSGFGGFGGLGGFGFSFFKKWSKLNLLLIFEFIDLKKI